MVGIAVAAFEVVPIDPGQTLQLETGPRLFGRRMGLNRERLIGGQDLEQVGQFAEPIEHCAAEPTIRFGGDDRLQSRSLGPTIVNHPTRAPRMGAQPVFRFGSTGRLDATQLGDRRLDDPTGSAAARR